MDKLKEHKIFRNQLIILTVSLALVGFVVGIRELIAFSIIFGLLALLNIYTYKQNKKEYNLINKIRNRKRKI